MGLSKDRFEFETAFAGDGFPGDREDIEWDSETLKNLPDVRLTQKAAG
jgi:hypothetical protein